MLKKIRVFLGKSNNIGRSTYFWNSMTGVVSAAQSPLILMAITRTNGLKDAGIFSIAYAVASLMLFIGQYGLRRYQSSDVLEQHAFGDYLGIRVITCIVMLLGSVGFCLYGMFINDYTIEKFLIVLCVCLLKLIQAFADVVHGRLQQCGRLDIAGKCSAMRILIETGIYIGCLILLRDLLIATVISILISIVILCISTLNTALDYCTFKPRFKSGQIKELLIAGFPLFCSYFLSMYISNAPKYAIDSYLSNELQAYYNFIFMPAFAVGVLANFIFNPILTTYAKIWVDKQFTTFNKLVVRQILVVAGITVVGLVVAYTIGIPVLSFIFGADLSSYRQELCVIMIGGGMLAYVTFFSTVLTIIRRQNLLLFGYVIISICAKLFSKFFVVNYGIIGAATLYTALMGVLAITFSITMVVKIKAGSAQKQV